MGEITRLQLTRKLADGQLDMVLKRSGASSEVLKFTTLLGRKAILYRDIIIPNTAVFGPTKLIETIASTARMKILDEDFG